MPRIRIVLEQHTPIMHFQHDQTGATIRATELKPRLDAFLIQCAFSNHSNEYKNYVVGYTDDTEATNRVKALDYRVRILQARGTIEELTTDDNTPYYAIGGEKHKAVLGNEVKQAVELIILSRHQQLIDAIKNWIGPFMMVTNFGFRKSKGFGSYTVRRIGDEEYNGSDCYVGWISQAAAYYWGKQTPQVYFFDDDKSKGWRKLMEDVKTSYSGMKRWIKENCIADVVDKFVKGTLIKPVRIGSNNGKDIWRVYYLIRSVPKDTCTSVAENCSLSKVTVAGTSRERR